MGRLNRKVGKWCAWRGVQTRPSSRFNPIFNLKLRDKPVSTMLGLRELQSAHGWAVNESGSLMKFRVGPWVYKVKVRTPGDPPLVDDDGTALDGRCEYGNHTIIISDAVLPDRRIEILAHELAHAWRWHFGIPGGIEGDCNQLASFAVDFMRQIQTQGGLRKLARLGADGIILHDVGDGMPSEHRANCLCGRMFSPGDAVNGVPKWDEDRDCLTICRTVYCESCDKPLRWTEGATIAGIPTGQIFGEPVFLEGPQAREFFAKNTQRTGIFLLKD